jgi:hypothetical protein
VSLTGRIPEAAGNQPESFGNKRKRTGAAYQRDCVGKTAYHRRYCLEARRYFGTSAKFWLGLQMDYDLDIAEDELGERLEREIRTRVEV